MLLCSMLRCSMRTPKYKRKEHLEGKAHRVTDDKVTAGTVEYYEINYEIKNDKVTAGTVEYYEINYEINKRGI